MPVAQPLPPPPATVRHRPQLVIAGFLGAGKTTLLRNLLTALADHSVTSDVILNGPGLDSGSLLDLTRDHLGADCTLAS